MAEKFAGREGREMAGGVLLLSIDWELEIDNSDQAREQRLDAAGLQLVELTQRLRIPATWAVADPLLSAATDQILRAGVGHEIAVLGDRSWIGPGSGRNRLARELDRRFQRARKVGIPVATLSLRNVEPATMLDLLHEHHIHAVRGPASDRPSLARKIGPPTVRYGVWQAPTAWRIPARQTWWLSGGWSIRRQLRRAIRRQELLHLVVDAPRLVDAGQPGLAALESLLTLAAARRDAGQLEIVTLGQSAETALRDRASHPTRSILRPAA
jgi:hypothetical protein